MCTCKPGTYEDGWQEKRCNYCLDRDMQVWYAMVDRFEREVDAAGGIDKWLREL